MSEGGQPPCSLHPAFKVIKWTPSGTDELAMKSFSWTRSRPKATLHLRMSALRVSDNLEREKCEKTNHELNKILQVEGFQKLSTSSKSEIFRKQKTFSSSYKYSNSFTIGISKVVDFSKYSEDSYFKEKNKNWTCFVLAEILCLLCIYPIPFYIYLFIKLIIKVILFYV